MAGYSSLPRSGVVYVTTVTAVGLTVVLFSLYELLASSHLDRGPWYILAGLTLLSGSATVKLPSVPASISISETFVFTAVMSYGPALGAVIVALDGLVVSLWLSQRRKELHRILFNMSGPALSVWLASRVYYLFEAASPPIALRTPNPLLPDAGIPIETLFGPLAAFALTHFILNSTIVALAVAFETRRPVFTVWRKDLFWLSINYFGAASAAALLAPYIGGDKWTYISIVVPLLLILYYMFKIPMARVEDANTHIAEVNRLYISTIETLAMAVDAKDQVTHGHIRRVQAYAVGLARALAVSDPGMIKAIEASALLHDMGKLAIPEYILNKPGKLTDAEFAKMRMHAGLGADILSAIAFPYPVIPIVRHHHENWDGSGYPSGLAGTQIPIGARILAVVDCYDALTSDRPYRPRLSDGEATSILVQRRGSMYDPHVVDTFITVHRTFAAPDAPTPSQAATYADIARLSTPMPSPTRHEQGIISSVNRAVGQLVSWSVTQEHSGPSYTQADSVLELLIEVTGAQAGFIAMYDTERDDLAIASHSGFGAAHINGCRLSLGQNLSGWVAANGQPLLNSDAVLDLACLTLVDSFGLRLAISVPLLENHGSCAGVVTLFSAARFSKEQFDTLQMLSSAVVPILNSRSPLEYLEHDVRSRTSHTRGNHSVS
jgi:HD-GYP domain-containing protein (c-di-GMP phosphodiesterase class II)